MDRRDNWRDASRERVKAAEARLERLREVIERRARLGFDTSEGWRLFRLTSTSLANMRQSEALIEALHQAGQMRWSATAEVPLAVNGTDRVAFSAGTGIQAPEPAAPDCYLIK